MSANRAKNTRPELTLRAQLYAEGVRGYRLHPKDVPGRPDISFRSQKLAVFINGCFWHRCPRCRLPLPKSNQEFWKEKFERNVKRDQLKIRQLKHAGWRVLVIWECEIEANLVICTERVRQMLA
jgi:DNA mismatch endonuclease (patch repair protein)